MGRNDRKEASTSAPASPPPAPIETAPVSPPQNSPLYNLQRLLFTEVVWPASRLAKQLENIRIPKATIEDKLPYFTGHGQMKALPDIRLRALDKSITQKKMTLRELKAINHDRDDHRLPLDFSINAPAGTLLVNVGFIASLLAMRP